MTRNETGAGYYLMAADGGVFNFGAPFICSVGGQQRGWPYTDIAAAGPLGGYRLLNANGSIITYGAPLEGGLYTPQPLGFAIGLAG